MSIDPAITHAMTIEDRVAQLEARHERMIRPGIIPKDGGIDNSDPNKPRFRIQHGVNKDGTPALGPWLPMMMHAGEMNKWTPASPGMQMVQFAPDGVFENGVLIPYTHSQNIPSPSTDLDHHVSQYGDHREDHGKQNHDRVIGTTSDHQDMNDKKVNVGGKIEHTAGDPAAAGSSGTPAAGVLMPHELNRIIQVHTARLGQHDHFLAGLHDTMSTLNTLAIPKVPALAALTYKLNNSPIGLQNVANDVTGKLPSYLSWSLLQTVSKLATTFLGGIVEAAQGNASSALSGFIGQAQAALAQAIQPPPPPPPPPPMPGSTTTTTPAPIDTNVYFTQAQEDAAANLLVQAAASVSAAASGATFELGAQLAQMTSLAAGTPAAGPLAAVVAQMQGIMQSTAGLMSGLSGLLDSQDNAASGTIKSFLLGGY